MKFSELLADAISSAEIPLRFEPGAEEAVAEPVTSLLKVWIAIHDPDDPSDDFAYGQRAMVVRLLEELEDIHDIPVEDEPEEDGDFE